MTNNTNKSWSDDELVILRSLMAEGADAKAIGRALRRHQTDVASKIFETKRRGPNDVAGAG